MEITSKMMRNGTFVCTFALCMGLRLCVCVHATILMGAGSLYKHCENP